jgi:hypothetical protein
VIHENREQNNDGQRDAEQPKQESASETHRVSSGFRLSHGKRRSTSLFHILKRRPSTFTKTERGSAMDKRERELLERQLHQLSITTRRIKRDGRCRDASGRFVFTNPLAAKGERANPGDFALRGPLARKLEC